MVELLINSLEDKHYIVRTAAAKALGEWGGSIAVDPLRKRLIDRSDSVRTAAANALARLGETKWQEIIRGDCKDFYRLIKEQSSVAGSVIQVLRSMINDSNFMTQRKAALTLIKIAKEYPGFNAISNEIKKR